MARLRTIYLVEGKTETALIEALKPSKIPAGKIIIFNIWNNPLSKLDRKLGKPKELQISLVVDTDITGNWSFFRENIQFLNARGYRYRIYVQHHNLEDELVYCCHKPTVNRLTRDFYHVQSVSEFKTRFAQDNHLSTTLQNNQFDFHKLWNRPDTFQQACQQQQIKARLLNT